MNTPNFELLTEMQRQALIRKLHHQGLSGADIARKVGVSRQRMHQIFQQLRLMARVPPSTVRRRKLPGLIRRGHCGASIAELLGVPTTTIYNDLRLVVADDPELQEILRENIRRAQSDAKKRMWAKRLKAKR